MAACSGKSKSDEEPVRGPRPPLPRIIAPKNGAYTGSVRAIGDRALRPQFVWAPVESDVPVTYDIQVDNKCRPEAAQDCPFVWSAAHESGLRATTWEPDSSLRVDSSPPVGRRYYWRVRACAGKACSPWSRVRYLEVGRARGDLDGDGYSDVVVGAPLVDNSGSDQGSVFVYRGNEHGVGDMTRLDDPAGHDDSTFGVAVSIAGDINGDGFDDLIVGASGTSDARGRAYIYYGTRHGVGPDPSTELRKRHGAADDWFGAAVAGAGDVNGDGFDDVIVGASGSDRPGEDWGVALVYVGSAKGIRTRKPVVLDAPALHRYDHFGFAVASAGDLDNDGYDDVAVGTPGIDAAGAATGTDRGAVYVYTGSAIGVVDTASTRLEAPVPLDHDHFGFAIAGAGDVDGDGYGDFIVGAPGKDSPVDDGGTAYLYCGSADGVRPVPALLLENPSRAFFDRFGTSVAGVGDVNGDGIGDFVVGTSSTHRGRALVYHGARELSALRPAVALLDPLGAGYNDFAESVAGAGDVNADGFDDLIIGASGSDNGGVFRGSVVIYPGSSSGILAKYPLRRDDPAQGVHDHFGHVVSGR